MSSSGASRKSATRHAPRGGHATDTSADGPATGNVAPISISDFAVPAGITFGLPPGSFNADGSGVVIFNSLGNAQDDAWNPHFTVLAQSFSTGAGTTSVTDVQLLLHYFGNNDGGQITVELFSDSSTSPGGLLATLGTVQDSSLPTSFGTVDLAVSGAPALTADTRYWIELTASTGNVNWGATVSTGGAEVSSEFMDVSGDVSPDGGGDNGETLLMSVTTDTACFAAGTRILTSRGEVAVEALLEGDRVVTAHAGGRLAPVRWVGRRQVAPARHPRPWDVNPIRVRAGALGGGRPHRDLWLSPDHALFLDGMLVRARDLLNGATVVQEVLAKITYFHVELDRHDVLFADGAPAESFLDTGNRAAFENGGASLMAHPDFSRAVWQHDACAPLVWQGPALAAVRAHLADVAGQSGWELTNQPDLHLVAGKKTVRPAMRGATLVFELPAQTVDVRLHSRSTVPAFVLADNIDTRVLGVAVTRLVLDGAAMPLDDPALGAGWLAPEPGLRWTNGAATLHVAGARRLEIGVANLGLPYWLAPPAAAPGQRAA